MKQAISLGIVLCLLTPIPSLSLTRRESCSLIPLPGQQPPIFQWDSEHILVCIPKSEDGLLARIHSNWSIKFSKRPGPSQRPLQL